MLSNLLDFAKHIGRKVFDTDAEAADDILNHIQTDNPGVDSLKVSYEDGVVTLTGRAGDQAAKEKVILMAGNVEGVERVDADGISVIPSVPEDQLARLDSQKTGKAPETMPADTVRAEADNTRFYIIQKGDTLYGIAQEMYGNGMKYPELFEANREVIEDPDRIYPGQKIRVPDLG